LSDESDEELDEEDEERDVESELDEFADEAREYLRLESRRRSFDLFLSLLTFLRLADSDRSRLSFFLLFDFSCDMSLLSFLESRLS